VKYQAEILDCFVNAKSSGQRRDASLLIRGGLVPVEVSNIRGSLHAFPAQLKGRQGFSIQVRLDDPTAVFSGNATRHAWLLILRNAKAFPGRQVLYAEGLVVVRCSNRASGFERIGMFEQEEGMLGTTWQAPQELLRQHNEAKDETIELF
jgi:hypothetical protein